MGPMRITNPANGATYLIDPTLRAQFQTVRLRASAPVTWQVNQRRIGSGQSVEWQLTPGVHMITATDARGSDSVKIFVR